MRIISVLYETPVRTHILNGRLTFGGTSTAIIALVNKAGETEVALSAIRDGKCLFYAKAENIESEMLAEAVILVYTQMAEISSDALRIALLLAGDKTLPNDPSTDDSAKYLSNKRTAELAREEMKKVSSKGKIAQRINDGLLELGLIKKPAEQRGHFILPHAHDSMHSQKMFLSTQLI